MPDEGGLPMTGASEPTARVQLAWLMWCFQQGYTNPADRAILTNWMGDDPATFTENDARAQRELLGMADEILALLPGQTPHEHRWDRAEVACVPAPGMPPVIHPAVSCACGTIIDLTCDGDPR